LYVDRINTVNRIVKANSILKNFKVIDLHSVFVNEKGLMREDLTTDGIHLNEKGYRTWTEFIKSTVHKLGG
jgi:lysophospholipase L1-like esterase